MRSRVYICVFVLYAEQVESHSLSSPFYCAVSVRIVHNITNALTHTHTHSITKKKKYLKKRGRAVHKIRAKETRISLSLGVSMGDVPCLTNPA